VTTYEWPTLTVNKGDQVYLQGTVAAGLLTDVNVYSGAPPTESDTTTFQILGTCDTHTGAWTQLLQGVPAYQAQSAYFNAGARLVNHLWSWSAD
jgi:hypothetical protein